MRSKTDPAGAPGPARTRFSGLHGAARGKKKIFSFKNNDDYSAIHTLISRPPGPPAFPVRPRPTGLPMPPGPAPAP